MTFGSDNSPLADRAPTNSLDEFHETLNKLITQRSIIPTSAWVIVFSAHWSKVPIWRVTRTLAGSTDGKFKNEVLELALGDNRSNLWMHQRWFRTATKSWRDGTATPAKINLLKRAHFEWTFRKISRHY